MAKKKPVPTPITVGSTWIATDEIGDPAAGLRVAMLAKVTEIVEDAETADGIGGEGETVVFEWIDGMGNPRRTAWDVETFYHFFDAAPGAVNAD